MNLSTLTRLNPSPGLLPADTSPDTVPSTQHVLLVEFVAADGRT